MGRYAILQATPEPAPVSIFDFIGAAMPMLMPAGLGMLGVTGASALAMQAVACVPDMVELTSAARAQPALLPQRPGPLPRSRLARQGWQQNVPRVV